MRGMMKLVKRIPALLTAVVMMILLISAATAENIVLICDYADLLTVEEEAELYKTMAELCTYCTPVFWTTDEQGYTDAETRAAGFLQDKTGTGDGVIFAIDLARREIVIYSTERISRTVTSDISNQILNNTYRLATDGDYAGCARTSFESILAVLEGRDIPAASKQPETDPDKTVILTRLNQFFQYWQMNRLEEMVDMCSSSWRAGRENAKRDLFSVLQNRTPVDYMPEEYIRDPENGSVRIPLIATISRNNGKEPLKYRMNVSMINEDGIWYIDPESLRYENVLQDPAIPGSDSVQTPTPQTDGNTVLYYNPDGGRLYHLDPNCISIHSKYTPLQGTFSYSQVNEMPYAELEPCNVCGAPLR